MNNRDELLNICNQMINNFPTRWENAVMVAHALKERLEAKVACRHSTKEDGKIKIQIGYESEQGFEPITELHLQLFAGGGDQP